MDLDNRFKLEFTADPRFISTARLFAAAAARYFGCDEDVVQDVKIAVSEACTNAVKAHEGTVVTLPVKVVVAGQDERVQFEVIDAGGGFDLAGRSSPNGETDHRLLESGVGLQIIQTLFPDTNIASNDEGGTTVSFTIAPAV